MSSVTDEPATTNDHITAVRAVLLDGFETRDATVMAAVFAANAMLQLRHQPLAAGSLEIELAWRTALGRGGWNHLELHPAELHNTGEPDRRREMGVYAADIVLDGRLELVEGTYTIVWAVDGADGVKIVAARFD